MADVPETTSSESFPASNADAFASVSEDIAAPPVETELDTSSSELGQTEQVAESPPAEVTTTPPVAESRPAMSPDALFAAMAPQFQQMMAEHMAKGVQHDPPKPEPTQATLSTDDLFADLAKNQLGEHAEHTPAHLVDERATLLYKTSQWQQHARRAGLDQAAKDSAAHSLASLGKQLAQNAHESSQASALAKVTRELAEYKARPNLVSADTIREDYLRDIPTHVASRAKDFPILSAAMESGSITAELIAQGIDFSDQDGAARQVLATLGTIERTLKSRVSRPVTTKPLQGTAPTTAPLSNPGILSPGTAPGAAASSAIPRSNEEVFRSLKDHLPN